MKCRYCYKHYKNGTSLSNHERTHKEYIRRFKNSKEQNKNYYNTHKEKYYQYYLDHKKEIKERKIKYHQTPKFKELNKIKSIEYRNKNKEKVTFGKDLWRKSERGKIRLAWLQHRRRIKKRNVIELFSKYEWLEKCLKTRGVCPGCNKQVRVEKLTMDHIYPISKAKPGRIYTIHDVQPLCVSCNSRKNNKLRGTGKQRAKEFFDDVEPKEHNEEVTKNDATAEQK